MTLRRFLVAFTAVFAGALAIETLNYHQLSTIAKDRWAIVPDLSGALLVFAALLVLAWPKRAAIGLFVFSASLSVLVGLAGTAFHYASRGLPLASAVSVTSWLGNPPPLAPLEFAVVGLLGLLVAVWVGGGTLDVSLPPVSAVCYAIGALSGFAALILAVATALLPAVGAITAALLIGALGFVVEVSRVRAV
ncbi:MAG TPA: hypothetical protein VMF11_14715 [Candidatus Baltobacteraceae bacterium]|nr:hypothetical protein [Candidatus Baltobacteraceae bacterium]